MSYIIAVFRSRNETLYFANMFRGNSLPFMVINTPKEAGEACGVSVRFSENYLPVAKQFLASKPFRAFSGFYRIFVHNGRNSVERIYA